ncbi:MAG: hypothetical protein ACFFAN_17075 [Promethearchaeota archaeon]
MLLTFLNILKGEKTNSIGKIKVILLFLGKILTLLIVVNNIFIDRFNKMMVVVVGSGYRSFVLNGEDKSDVRKYEIGYIFGSSPASGDIDGDYRLETIVGTIYRNGEIYAINSED